jgi:hypothetical protein
VNVTSLRIGSAKADTVIPKTRPTTAMNSRDCGRGREGRCLTVSSLEPLRASLPEAVADLLELLLQKLLHPLLAKTTADSDQGSNGGDQQPSAKKPSIQPPLASPTGMRAGTCCQARRGRHSAGVRRIMREVVRSGALQRPLSQFL